MSEPEWDLEERDRIAGLDRDLMIRELAALDADVIWDDGHKDFEGLVQSQIDGNIGYRFYSDWQLRNEMYDNSDIPQAERRFREGEVEHPEFSTVGDLIQALWYHKRTDKGNYVDTDRWQVTIRIDLDGDVLIASRVTDVKIDGFHQTVTVSGPRDKEE